MKKILLGLALVSSFSSFAGDTTLLNEIKDGALYNRINFEEMCPKTIRD